MRCPLVLQLYQVEGEAKEYAEFLRIPSRKITDFGNVLYFSNLHIMFFFWGG